MKYRKKPVVIDAIRWFQDGDHTEVQPYVVKTADEKDRCVHCGLVRTHHGWIDTLEGGHIVCPNDYIITGVKGEHYPCKPDIFELTYEPVISVEEVEKIIKNK